MFKNRYDDASSMPLTYSEPKYGLNSLSGLGCRGVLNILDFGPSSPCNSSFCIPGGDGTRYFIGASVGDGSSAIEAMLEVIPSTF